MSVSELMSNKDTKEIPIIQMFFEISFEIIYISTKEN
jgi:hypothetical protein